MNSKIFKSALIVSTIAIVLGGCGSTVMAAPRGTLAQNSASKAAEVKESRVEKLKIKAQKEIDRRVATLSGVLTKLGVAKKLTEADKTLLNTQIQQEITDLDALKTKIIADTDIATLKTDVQSIVKSYRVYALIVPKTHILLVSDRILSTNERFNEILTKLQAAIDKAKAAGTDVTSWQAALDDMKAKIADAKTQADTARSDVVNLTPDQFNANPSVLKPAREALKNAKLDLETARKDAQTIIQALKGEKLELKETLKSKKSPKTSTSSSVTP